MNFIGSVILSSFLGMSLNSCSVAMNGGEESGKTVSKRYNVTAFHRIDNESVADISFTQDPATRVEAQGGERYLACLEVKVKDSTLFIRIPKKDSERFKNAKVTINVSSPELGSVLQKGVGDVILNGKLQADHLTLNVNGVGDLKAEDLDVRKLEATQRGVGDLLLKGKCDRAELEQKGVGDLKAKNLDAAHAIIRQKGVGDLSCRASKTISIQAKGIGNVDYYGNAQVVELKKSGLGSVEKRD